MLLGFTFLSPLFGLSQADSTKKKIDFGFYVGADQSLMGVEESENFVEGVTTNFSASGANAIGFHMGLVFAKQHSDQVHQRLFLGGRINNSEVTYSFSGQPDADRIIYPMSAQLGTLLGYQLNATGHGIEIVGGGDLSYSIPTNKPTLDGLKEIDFHLKVGAGYLIQGRFAKVHMDLMYSHSLVNLLGDSQDIYNLSLGRLQKHMITLTISGY